MTIRQCVAILFNPASGAVLGKVSVPEVRWLAVGEQAIWVTTGTGTLFGIDPVTTRITGRAELGPGSNDCGCGGGHRTVAAGYGAGRCLRFRFDRG